MDKNTFIGFLLIAVILIVFSWLNRPSPEMIEKQKRYNDSIARVQQIKEESEAVKHQADSLLKSPLLKKDLLTNFILEDAYGDFGIAAVGEEKFITIENEFLKITFTNKGAQIYSVELKDYRRHDFCL